MTIKLESQSITYVNDNEGILDDSIVPELIWNYLVHAGYSESAKAFLRLWASADKHENYSQDARFSTMEIRKSTI
jgi:hypothetical protein